MERNSIATINVFFVKDGKVLFLKLKPNTSIGLRGVLSFKFDAKKNLLDCVTEQAKVQLSISINKDFCSEPILLRHFDHKNNIIRYDYYLECHKRQGEFINNEWDKYDKLSWFSYEKFPNDTVETIKIARDNLRNNTVYQTVDTPGQLLAYNGSTNINMTMGILLIKDAKILLLQKEKSGHLVWTIPHGLVSQEEDIYTSMNRILNSTISVSADENNIINPILANKIEEDTLNIGYFLSFIDWNGSIDIKSPFIKFERFSFEDIPDNVTKDLKSVLHGFKQKLNYLEV